MLTPAEIESIRQRAEKATEGPWYVDEAHVSAEDGTIVTDFISSYFDRPFIAHARQDIPSLLSHIEELEKELHDFREDARDLAVADPPLP